MVTFVLSEWTASWYNNAKPEAQLEFRNWLKNTLQSERMNISFKKADGTVRNMHCSLHPELLPPITQTESNKIKKENSEVLAVFDLDKQAWRSFRLDSIQDFSYNLGELHV